jgi:solute:Na+ symporter, SSS family
VIVTAITLAYSVLGGLRASLRTDVLQMTILIAVLAGLLLQTVLADGFAAAAIVASSPDTSGPGWVLLAVAALQVWSYPLHDPVMMDRGFLADRDTTRRSFHHACWLSLLCIVSFGLLGVYAGLLRQDGEELMTTLTRLMGEPTMLLLQFALVLSAVSTLDSTLSSAAKLSVVDMRLAEETTANGRIGMVVFMLGGLILLFLGSKDLFSAVAISGTASMFLAPVVFFCILSDHRVPQWAFVAAFTASIGGSVVYFLESAGHVDWIAPLTGFDHDYSKLLLISLAILSVGCGAFAIGARRRESGAAGLTSP